VVAGRGNLAARHAATTRVLVVEDEPDIVDFLRAFFRASGYDIVHVDPSSPRHVLARVRESSPDCVLLDVRLRGFSGFDAYRAMRDDPDFDLTPVILVTADTTANIRAVGVAGDLDGFVQKPFSVKALESLVAERVERARRVSATGGAGRGGDADFVDERLRAEVRAAIVAHGHVSFALVRMRDTAPVRRDVGQHGVVFACRRVADHLVEELPAGAIVASTTDTELSVILPGMDRSTGEKTVRAALESLAPVAELPGGAVVPLTVSAGLAAAPEHASTGDQLYMAADAALADAADAGELLAVAH
jgi:DNA-binding response OmpR family regulator